MTSSLKNKDLKFFELLHLAIGKGDLTSKGKAERQNGNWTISKKTRPSKTANTSRKLDDKSPK